MLASTFYTANMNDSVIHSARSKFAGPRKSGCAHATFRRERSNRKCQQVTTMITEILGFIRSPFPVISGPNNRFHRTLTS